MTDSLYFAYGSNLCPDERARWLAQHGLTEADLRPVSAALLPDHALSFGYWSQRRAGGALDVRSSLGSVVQGALFAVSPLGWRMLDIKEGVAHPDTGYERTPVQAVLPDGKLVAAITYTVKPADRRPHCEPASGYVDTVLSGLAHWQMRPDSKAALLAAAAGQSGDCRVEHMLVYGTLMRGELRWPAMARAGVKQVLMARSRATLHPATEDPPGEPFPAITLDQPLHELQGDLVESADIVRLLQDADAIETFWGHGDARNLYHRTILPVQTAASVQTGASDALPRGGPKPTLAWAYVAAPLLPVGEPHDTGCWRAARGRRRAFLERLVRAHGQARLQAMSPPVVQRPTPANAATQKLVLSSLGPEALVQALDEGSIAEWHLARESGCWTALAVS